MKNILKIALLLLLPISLHAIDYETIRVSKKDKKELMDMLNQPVMRMEKWFGQLSAVVDHIQNFIADITSPEGHEGKYCQKTLEHLKNIEEILKVLSEALLEQGQVLGHLDDVSVSDQDFDSVEDIDNARLSLVSLLKTIYREQLRDKFIS